MSREIMAIHYPGLDKENKRQLDIDIDCSVYQYPWKWFSFRGFFNNIREFFFNRKMAKQRAKWGYCERDTWSCGDHLVDITLQMLVRYRNEMNSYPSESFPSFEVWREYLDEAIGFFEVGRKDPDELNCYFEEYEKLDPKGWDERTEEEKELMKKYFEESNRIGELQRGAIVQGYSLIAPYMHTMWW